MVIVDELRALDRNQRAAFIASFLGWALDAFDFFLLTFVIKDIATDFGVAISRVSTAIVLTLVARPIGAFIFGRLADRFGRRPVLMADVILYSLLALASAFSPNLTVLLILRTLFGVAGASAPPWRWRPCRRRAAAWSPASCRKATPWAISWRRWPI